VEVRIQREPIDELRLLAVIDKRTLVNTPGRAGDIDFVFFIE
jgi:hypothetical protein